MDKSWGGARHSGAVLITETGYEILTRLDAGYLPYRNDCVNLSRPIGRLFFYGFGKNNDAKGRWSTTGFYGFPFGRYDFRQNPG